MKRINRVTHVIASKILFMLDIAFIRDNRELMERAIRDKHLDADLDTLLRLDVRRSALITEIEGLRSQKNNLNDRIKNAPADQRANIIEEGKSIKEQIQKQEPLLRDIEDEFTALLATMPTPPAPDVPVGGEEANKEIFSWGEKPVFSFVPKTHMELGKSLDILDLDRGTKVSGYRGYYLKNDGALLVMAIMMYAMHKMVAKGFTPMIPPTLVKEFALFGSGYFKGLEYDSEVDEIYQVATRDKEADGSQSGERKFLVGTAEPSLLAYYAGETLDESMLPMKLCGYSQCYRSEIGSYGKDTKGMYRVHEFMKIEQVVIARADLEEAEQLHRNMVSISQEMHEELGLPYRQLAIATADSGVGKYRQFDLEAWAPGMSRWCETGSASNFLDWQARRLNVKYKSLQGERKFVYMMNNTALPSPRIFIAILENYQQADGSIRVPEVLQKYMGKNQIGGK